MRIPARALAPGTVVGVEIGGREYVVWRGGSGALGSAPRRCPHLDEDLLGGAVAGDELVCPGHGWSFDCAGRAMKRNERGRADPKGEVTTLALIEHDGVVEALPLTAHGDTDGELPRTDHGDSDGELPRTDHGDTDDELPRADHGDTDDELPRTDQGDSDGELPRTDHGDSVDVHGRAPRGTSDRRGDGARR